MRVIHQRSGQVLGRKVIEARSFWRRLRGYMFYSAPPSEFDGLFFPRCQQVHNSFVRFSLDVIFLDRENRVTGIVRGFRPWRLTKIYWKASSALEFPAGTLPADLANGDQIGFET